MACGTHMGDTLVSKANGRRINYNISLGRIVIVVKPDSIAKFSQL